MRVFSVVGPSGSGKTTLIERLVPRLRSAGLRVGVLKHSHHDRLDLDRPGKDTFRARAAGADVVAALSGTLWFTVERLGEPSLAVVLERLRPAGVDVLLVESFRSARLPCIEVVGRDGERTDPARIGPLLCVATAAAEEGVARGEAVPCFALDDADSVARFLVENLEKGLSA